MTVWLLLARLGSVVVGVTFAVFGDRGTVGRARRWHDHHGEACRCARGQRADRRIDRAGAACGGTGEMNAGPEVWRSETKVVLAGTMSVSATVWASLGPALATVIV